MFKLKLVSVLIGSLVSANCLAMTAQIDPDNPNGYIVSRGQINAAQDAKTPNPMYDIWAKALETRANNIVEAISPGATTNPANVQRVERVFPQSESETRNRG